MKTSELDKYYYYTTTWISISNQLYLRNCLQLSSRILDAQLGPWPKLDLRQFILLHVVLFSLAWPCRSSSSFVKLEVHSDYDFPLFPIPASTTLAWCTSSLIGMFHALSKCSLISYRPSLPSNPCVLFVLCVCIFVFALFFVLSVSCGLVSLIGLCHG